MRTHEKQAWQRRVVLVLAGLLALPPGALTNSASASSRTNALSRIASLETFRNPQISGGWNRHLDSYAPSSLVGHSGGGEALSRPEAMGYQRQESPLGVWLPLGRFEWSDTDLALPGVGLPLVFERVWRGSVTAYEGPLGDEWDFSWNKRLFEEGDGDVVFYELGRAETYDELTGTYTSPPGRYDTLVGCHETPSLLVRRS